MENSISILIKIPILTVGVRNPQKYLNVVEKFSSAVRYDLDPVTDALQILASFFCGFNGKENITPNVLVVYIVHSPELAQQPRKRLLPGIPRVIGYYVHCKAA